MKLPASKHHTAKLFILLVRHSIGKLDAKGSAVMLAMADNMETEFIANLQCFSHE